MKLAPATLPHGAHHEAPRVENLVRHAHEALAAAHVSVSPAKVSRLCRQYARTVAPHGVPFTSWFVSQVATAGGHQEPLGAELYLRIIHADPTGETATRNVDRARQGVAG